MFCFKEWVLILTSWHVHGQVRAHIPDTHTDWWLDWLLSVWAEMLDWLLPLDLCMTGWAVCTSATVLWRVLLQQNLYLCIFLYHVKPLFQFSCFPTVFIPPLSLHPADKGPSAGPHGEGGLAGSSDLQGDWDDQWGQLVSKPLSLCCGKSHSDPDWNMSTNVSLIALTFCSEIHGAQRINADLLILWCCYYEVDTRVFEWNVLPTIGWTDFKKW